MDCILAWFCLWAITLVWWQYSNCTSGLLLKVTLLSCMHSLPMNVGSSITIGLFSWVQLLLVDFVAWDSSLSPSNTIFVSSWSLNASSCSNWSSSSCTVELASFLVFEVISSTWYGSQSVLVLCFHFCYQLHDDFLCHHLLRFHPRYHRNPLFIAIQSASA